jgi:dTDP-4-dehydrorhamnose 3,5-epimerase-like enzyme
MLGGAMFDSSRTESLLKEEKEYIFANMHVTMSSLRADDVVPLHDHGSAEGFLFIASGEVRIKTYSVEKRDSLYLTLVTDKVYKSGEHVLVTKKNNVHSIEALKKTEIVDAFSVSPDDHVQTFLKVIGKPEANGSLMARFALVDEVNIASHILEKDRTMPKIHVKDDTQ